MSSFRPTIICALSLVLLSRFPCPTHAQTNNIDNDPSENADAVRQLGHARFAEREKATRYLWSQGAKARAALTQAAGSDDPEIAVRATQILEWIASGLMPDMPDNIAQLVHSYRESDENTKYEIVLELLADTEYGIAASVALLRSEVDARARKRICARASAKLLHAVRTMLISGADDTALELLRIGALADNDVMMRALTLFAFERSSIAEEIQYWKDLPDHDSALHLVLLHLYRAVGNRAAALQHAESSGRKQLLKAILQEQGAWQRLLEIHDEQPRPDNVEWLGYRAAYLRLSGHTNELEHAVFDIEALAMNDLNNNGWYAAEALMLNDYHDRAISLLIEARRLGQAAQLLLGLNRYDEIVALADDIGGLDTNQLTTLSLITNLVSGTAVPASAPSTGPKEELESKESDLLSEADAKAADRDWPAAAILYANLSKEQPESPLLLFLHGLALSHSGRAAEGKRLMTTASLLCLNSQNQYVLATELKKRGHVEESTHQWELAFHTSACGSWQWGESLRHFAIPRARRGADHTTAASYAELNRLRCLDTSCGLLDVTGYLAFSSQVAAYRILAELEAGDIDAMITNIHAYQRMFPGDIELPILVRPMLKDIGQQALADEVFNTTYQFLDALCRKYPNAGHVRNAIAWLAARCGKQLDGGLEHAQRAVELDPRCAPFIDTLAEIFFQLGRREEALELIRKCVELEPKEPYFRRQLTRIERNDTATAPE